MPDEGEPDSELEAMINESLAQKPSFQNGRPFDKKPGKPLLDFLLPASAAAATAALSFPGNPFYTPPAVGAITYMLTDKAVGLLRESGNFKGESLPLATSNLYNRVLRIFKPVFSAAAVLSALAFSSTQASGSQTEGSISPELAYAAVSGISAYIVLSGLERVLHSQSLSTTVHLLGARWNRARGQPEKEASHLEQISNVPHSKEKEASLLLRLGNSYLEAGQGIQAIDTHKRFLRSSGREDTSAGPSDWLIRANSNSNAPEGSVQKAMHEYFHGELESANATLAQAAANEPKNRQLHVIRALFFRATGNDALADRELLIYERLVQGYEPFGKTRNIVSVPKDDSSLAPELFAKGSAKRVTLEEELDTITALSGEPPLRPIGQLPPIIETRERGGNLEAVLGSIGDANLKQKTLAGMLTEGDLKKTMDLLVNTTLSLYGLYKQGKIKVHEPMLAETYTYQFGDMLKELGMEATHPNIVNGQTLYFSHWINDVFILGVQRYNGINFTDKFSQAVFNGVLALSSKLLEEPRLNLPYSDFTYPNIIVSSTPGDVTGKADFEQIRILPFLLEMVNVLEMYQPNLAQGQFNELFEYALKNLGYGLGQSLDTRVLGKRYHSAATIRHLGLIGYRSRDSVSNPQDVKAQAYHYLMAKMHLADAIGTVERPERAALKEMQEQIESTPILNDERQQREIELEIRRQIGLPNNAYLAHEFTSKRHLKGMAKDFFGPGQLRDVWPPWKNFTVKNSGLVKATAIFIELPLVGAAGTATAIPVYYAMQKIMPSL